MEDDKIILLLNNNPSKGLYEVTKKYGGIIKAITCKIIGTNKQEDIEECIVDTFISVWKNIKNIDNEKGSLKGLIVCTARNTAIDRYRKLHKHEFVYLDDENIASDTDVISEVSKQIETETLQNLIYEMNEPDREIFIRKYFLFEKIKEIACRLGLNEKDIENRLYKGRQKLKGKLKERGVSL